MTRTLLAAGAVVAALAFGQQAQADQIAFSFGGSGISSSGTFMFDPTDPDAVSGGLPITGMSGTFSDSNTAVPIVNASITGVLALTIGTPRGAPFPNSLSFLSVTNPPPMDTAISYDNLYYPDGSPITCDGYLYSGGFLDVFGVTFALDNGDLVDLYSNGDAPFAEPLIYGAIVVDMSMAPENGGAGTIIDNVGSGIAAGVPEPSSFWLLGAFLLGVPALRKRSAAARR
ncbi:MAG: hypothetical protein WBQ75_13775 [Acetobacteraceae bacterium]